MSDLEAALIEWKSRQLDVVDALTYLEICKQMKEAAMHELMAMILQEGPAEIFDEHGKRVILEVVETDGVYQLRELRDSPLRSPQNEETSPPANPKLFDPCI